MNFDDFRFTEWYSHGNVMQLRVALRDDNLQSIPYLFKCKYGISIYDAVGVDWPKIFNNERYWLQSLS